MKRFLILVCVGLLFVEGVCTFSVEAASSKQATYIGAQKKQEKGHQKKKKVMRTPCGQSGHPIRIATFETNPPFGWVDVENYGLLNKDVRYVSRGFSADVFRKMAESVDLRVRQVGYPSYEQALRALSRGEVDVLVGTYYDPYLGRIGGNFVIPSFFQNAIVAVFLKGKEKPINGFEDLAGLKGVVREDEHFYKLIYKGLPKGLQIQQVSNAEEAYKLLVTGQVDYLLSSPYAAEAEARRFKVELDIELSEKALMAPELFFVFSRSSECRVLRSTFSKLITEGKKNPEQWQKLLVHYINQWGKRFKDEPGIREIIESETEGKDKSQGEMALKKKK